MTHLRADKYERDELANPRVSAPSAVLVFFDTFVRKLIISEVAAIIRVNPHFKRLELATDPTRMKHGLLRLRSFPCFIYVQSVAHSWLRPKTAPRTSALSAVYYRGP